MSREEDKKLLAELMFVGEQLQNTLSELKKLDGIAARAAALNEVDTQKILEQLDRVNMIKISHEITKSLKNELEKSREEISTSSGSLEVAAKDLTQKSELLKESSDSLMQIDAMASDLQEVAKDIKKWRIKSMYAAIGLSLFFGVASGVIVSNIGSLLTPSQTIQNAEILSSKFGKIFAAPNETNPNVFYLGFGARELSPVVKTVEQDGVRYIILEAQK